jgi:hypothetical protein
MLKSNKISDTARVIYEFQSSNISIISIVKRPTVLITKSVMDVPKWIVYVIGIAIVFLGIVLAAAIVFLILAPRAGLHTEDCKGRSCQSGLNLKCLNNKCACLSNQY